VTDIDAEIHRLSARRQEIWGGSPDTPGEAQRLAKQLADLYEERRFTQARSVVGSSSNVEIVRRARVESELERLIDR
jgi:hypothetical protein